MREVSCSQGVVCGLFDLNLSPGMPFSPKRLDLKWTWTPRSDGILYALGPNARRNASYFAVVKVFDMAASGAKTSKP